MFLLTAVVQKAVSRGLQVPGGAGELGAPTTSRAQMSKVLSLFLLVYLSGFECRISIQKYPLVMAQCWLQQTFYGQVPSIKVHRDWKNRSFQGRNDSKSIKMTPFRRQQQRNDCFVYSPITGIERKAYCSTKIINVIAGSQPCDKPNYLYCPLLKMHSDQTEKGEKEVNK